jgi:hypothetical protein
MVLINVVADNTALSPSCFERRDHPTDMPEGVPRRAPSRAWCTTRRPYAL